MNRNSAAGFVRPVNIILLLIAPIAVACPAHAEPGHWYVAGSATGSALKKPRQTIANAPVSGSTLHVVNDVDFGWGGQGEVGYIFRTFRIEAEIGHTANHSDRYSAISPISITLPQSGKNTVTRYMANAYVEPFRARWPLSPYVGFGIGAAHGHLTAFAAPARAPAAPPSELLDIKDTRFVYQAIGGVSAPVTSRFAVTAQYRWLDGGTFQGVDTRGEPATRTIHGSNVDLGLRVMF